MSDFLDLNDDDLSLAGMTDDELDALISEGYVETPELDELSARIISEYGSLPAVYHRSFLDRMVGVTMVRAKMVDY